MQNCFKRLTGLLLACLMILSCLPMQALAENMDATEPVTAVTEPQETLPVDPELTEPTEDPDDILPDDIVTEPTGDPEEEVPEEERPTVQPTEPSVTEPETTEQETTAQETTEQETTVPETTEPLPPLEGKPVTTAEELEAALAAKEPVICVTQDLTVDRTFYITYNVTIFSKERVVLTRAADFAGEFFVVGEYADGTAAESEEDIVLTLGDPSSQTADLLVLDGNKANLTVQVDGTAIFVCAAGRADLYANLTVQNFKKTTNVRTLLEQHGVSYPERIGGAGLILAKSAEANIYGGIYQNNEVNGTSDVAFQGGFAYNFGVLNVYGGTFEGNYANSGAAVFNYRTANIYAAQILRNTASDLGGAIYMPNSTGAVLNLGQENEVAEPSVLFQGNTAADDGGAIYARNKVNIKNTQFKENSTTGYGGAIVAYATVMTVEDSLFYKNTANYGGAIFLSGSNEKETLELTVKNTDFQENSTTKNGGAIYAEKSARIYGEDLVFDGNKAYHGGAVFCTAADVELNGAQICKNTTSYYGAGIYVGSTDEVAGSVTLNNIEADSNSASRGGFAYVTGVAELTVYNSSIKKCSANGYGGAIGTDAGTAVNVYGTAFEENTATGTGGAVTAAGAANILLHSCSFLRNSSSTNGGVLYATGKAQVEIYNMTATGNQADKGGALYITTTGTVVNLAGMVVSGNTATNGGPIIWGNSTGAKLYIDKNKFIDLDATGDMDDAYWAAAIYNSLKVYTQNLNMPNYVDYDGTEVVPQMATVSPDVYSAAQLERALAAGHEKICICADFQVDRTFYITKNVTVYSKEAHTLTRAADFAGDIFVVGEYADGTAAESEEDIVLTLGDPGSKTANLLVLDGNKDNLTVDVAGSAIFVCAAGRADLYDNLTVQNFKKVTNDRTAQSRHGVSYPERIGGAGLILAKNAEANIYGGIYQNNEVNSVTPEGEAATTCFQGGFAYNFGVLNVYGGTFEGNYAQSGAALFNYRTANIYAAQILRNTASDLGGAIYMPNSTGAVLNLGQENEVAEPSVLFQGNTAADDGGAIYARNKVNIKNTQFKENSTTGYGGAIVAYATVMTVEDSLFYKNTANYGGAIFLSGSNEKETLELTVKNTDFQENSTTKNGGAIYAEKSARIYGEDLTFDGNAANYGGAVYCTGATVEINGADMDQNSAANYGGAVSVYSSGKVTLNAVNTEGNSATRGGFAYANESELAIYNSHIYKNTATTGYGGAIGTDASAIVDVYATTFEQNTAAGTGGAITAASAADILLHSCSFLNNASDNYGGVLYATGKAQVEIYNMTATGNHGDKGGALYITTTGTVVNLVGMTVSGNTATNGGPIIWGNSTGAKLNIDKAKWTDSDATGSLDSTYWKAAIYNKLTVNEITGTVPKYLDYGNETYDHMADAVDVASAQELEAAILSGADFIRIVGSFQVDRTFYITKDVTIFTTAPQTLTRAPDFGGDMFVVGQAADGTSCVLLGTDPTLILGNPVSAKENLLIIDGNKDNMTVDVKGTVVFIFNGTQAELCTNVTVRNCHKAGNERTLTAGHSFSRANRVGGPVAIVENGVLTIRGGNYLNNSTRDEETVTEEDDSGRDSTLGGVIYNYSTVRIYGGTFQGNHAARGGVCYNYKVMKITQGNFVENTASASGGVLYAPNAAAAHLRIGSETGDQRVTFTGNQAKTSGGAIYSSYLCTVVIYGNTAFTQNDANSGSGGAICGYGQMTVRDTVFTGNIAGNRGGAVFASRSSDSDDSRYVEITDCEFTENEAYTGGAVAAYASSTNYPEGTLMVVKDTAFTKNSANTGGAVYCEKQSSFTAENCSFTENSSEGESGAIYVSGNSTAKLVGGSISNNTAGGHGGAMSVRSSRLEVDGTVFSNNTAGSNGGAVYVSYISSQPINATVIIRNATFENNASDSYGGVIYATRHTVDAEKDTRILSVKDSAFRGNSAKESGGVLYMASKVEGYFADCTFEENESLEGQGGVLYTTGGKAVFERNVFAKNAAKTTGGGISVPGKAQVILYQATAEANTSGGYGGFLYAEDAAVEIYGGEMNRNQSGSSGGAVALFGTAVTGIYDTGFTENTAATNGGALFIYTESTKTVLHTNTFEGNHADGFGGAMEMSKVSLVDIYDITAKNNSAKNGGFIYETSAGTTVTLVGATVSGNTATAGGPIIWGNTANADLYIDKSKFVDLDSTGALDAAYWAAAIVNKLTVIEQTGTVPAKPVYTPEPQEQPEDPVQKKPVPVTDVFDLAENCKDGYISKVYDKLSKLDASSNFMSKGTIVYPNINGTDVTVDTFVYPEYGTADNMNVGQGLLIFQAMQYKKAHPEEEVYIDIASYRFSVEAAVNINRNSRYFGYMRNLYGMEYDENGFVRISYLLVTAAKMGIHVNVIGHIDGYPISEADPNLAQYFVNYLGDPCDPAYAQDAVIGDYMEFTKVKWALDAKGGNDMMHTKMCAVSHYLDINGKEHRNAVFSSSSNLDGIRSDAANGNWKLQTGSIVSDHAEIYRMTVNYLRLISRYGKYQEGVYEFQDIMSTRSTEQIELILAGRESEIPADEQIVYLGSETDQVFELYFTPFGGGTLEWDETTNPYCKYLRKLYDSEGSIIFTWNAAEYSSSWALAQQMEDLIVAAFHKIRSPENKFYGVMNTFDGSRLADLEVGKDIGYVSVNNRPLGKVHNKDVQVSYVENGQRYYVTLLNSLNLHSGSMYYQSNFLLVVKETECLENGVFFTLAEHSTQGIVEHDYGQKQVYYPSENEDGYYYKECRQCGKREILGVAHQAGQWTVHIPAQEGVSGVQKLTCRVCGELLEAREYTAQDVQEIIIPYKQEQGKTFTAASASHIQIPVTKTPRTLEAKIHVPKSVLGRGGVIVGNYALVQDDQLNLEIYVDGKVRLYYINNLRYESCVFDPDIRSKDPVHIAVTADDVEAKLYINGVLADTKPLTLAMPEQVEKLKIGSDNRIGNLQYFKGTIYSVSLFDEVRTQEQILRDAIVVSPDEESVLYTKIFAAQESGTVKPVDTTGRTFSQSDAVKVKTASPAAPYTVEAGIVLPEKLTGRGGVILGNYDNGPQDQLSLEIHENGRFRLFYISKGRRFDYTFSQDLRTGKLVNLALTVDGDIATLYVDGQISEQIRLEVPFPKKCSDLRIGGDNRLDNVQYFKGKITYVHLFDHVRTDQELEKDSYFVAGITEGLMASYYLSKDGVVDNVAQPAGQTFTQDSKIAVEVLDNRVPATVEALIHVPQELEGRGGVILGNYGNGQPNQWNLEVYEQGRLRIYCLNNWVRAEHFFQTDIRADRPVHIAVTVQGGQAVLYVDGVEAERGALAVNIPASLADLLVGSDNRPGNAQYFKGTIYAVALYEELRTPEQIRSDCLKMGAADTGAILSGLFLPNTDRKGDGKQFTQDGAMIVPTLEKVPATVEAWVRVPLGQKNRAGVLFGNYDNGSQDQLNVEIYDGGKVRLFYIANGVRTDKVFKTDIRSREAVHLAITVDGDQATMFLNGKAVETVTLPVPMGNVTENFKIGGDNRLGNTQYFKGTVYNLAVFDSPRTEEQIAKDMLGISGEEEGLLYTMAVAKEVCPAGDGLEGHKLSQWIEDLPADGAAGVSHQVCTVCGKQLSYRIAPAAELYGQSIDYVSLGKTFATYLEILPITETLYAAPKTFEVMLQLDPEYDARGGVLVGNYTADGKNVVNVEVYNNGLPRFYYRNNYAAYTVQFTTDVRSKNKTHLTLVIDGMNALLYVNGVLKETAELTVAVPNVSTGYCIGGDARTSNYQNFKGTIYSVHLFSDVRTPEEIATDAVLVLDRDNLLYQEYLGTDQGQRAKYDLEGKVIVNFGDSIFGNYKAPDDISTMIANKTGATVYNVGFGSAQMSKHSTEKYNTFSMEKLAEAVTTGNFSLQESVVASGNAPTAYTRCLGTLKSIDFNKVDIITIAYGTNDFKNGKSLDSVRNAAERSIEMIRSKYPDIEIVLCIPVYRYWLDDAGNFLEDSNTKEINGVKLTDYINLYKQIGNKYGLLVIDNYNGSGISAANRSSCFTGTDTTHPNETGRQMIAENMAKELYNHFG